MSDVPDVTLLLRAWKEDGDAAARDRVFALVDRELQAIAASRLRSVPGLRHRLEPAELVSELYLRLNAYGVTVANRHFFFGLVSEIMRGILVDYLRNAKAQKRPSTTARVVLDNFDSVASSGTSDAPDLVAIYDALDRLRELSPNDALVFEEHAILGLTLDELSTAHDVSTGTIKRQLRRAKAWLAADLSRS